jgi:uncharacterized membrane protein
MAFALHGGPGSRGREESVVRSRAAIGRHPIHPALVALPIGSFFLVFVADVLHALRGDVFWYDFGATPCWPVW